ncbi:uncharacterized ATP-dependent helicase C17A2.12 [Fopius arisanus]|uniref:Uncharacterized ATP-dependent helicase C17A2.12 n=2 Tax=Fopius arisanus TaxID=64838 RepID=A0A9R1T8M9_9HYME|nr:PREDICTED: uncharacterized ATP-dependent helicase C17A2.12-like [Fopius arisanus]
MSSVRFPMPSTRVLTLRKTVTDRETSPTPEKRRRICCPDFPDASPDVSPSEEFSMRLVIPSGAAEASKSFQNVLKYLEKIEKSQNNTQVSISLEVNSSKRPKSFQKVLNYLDKMEESQDNSQASTSLDPSSSKPSTSGGDPEEPSEFIEFETLDEDLPLEVEPVESSVPSAPVNRLVSPEEFQPLELYEPDEDVDVGWKTDDDFSDGEVPAQVRYIPKKNISRAPHASTIIPERVPSNVQNPPVVNNALLTTRNIPLTSWNVQNPSPSTNFPLISWNAKNFSSKMNNRRNRNNRWSRRGRWRRYSTEQFEDDDSNPYDPKMIWDSLASTSRATAIDQGPGEGPVPQDNPQDLMSSDSEMYFPEYDPDESSLDSPPGLRFKQKPTFDDETMRKYLNYYLPKSKSRQTHNEKTQMEGLETVEAILKIHDQLQTKPEDEARTSTPRRMRVKLLEHQEKALSWMLWRESCTPAGGILADDMGLGKTVTAIALMMRSREIECGERDDRVEPGGTLIVCPANLIPQWKQEIETRGCIPDINIYHKDKETNIWRLRSNQIVITSYDTLFNNHKTRAQILFKIHWKRVILDEAHIIRNPNSLRSECVAALVTQKRWVLTGTPIHNLVKDIFPIMRFLKVRPFDNLKHFNKWVANNDAAGTARLHCIMEAVMLRRTKDAMMKAGLIQLPLKTKRDVTIVLVPEERLVYDRVMTYSRTLFIQFLHQKTEKERRMVLGPCYTRNNNYNDYQLTDAQKKFLERREEVVSRHHILTLILRLRQICCHPHLITKFLAQEDFEEAGVDNLPVNKLEDANKLLQDLAAFDGGEEIGVDGRVVDRRILTADNPVFRRESRSSKMTAVLQKVEEIVSKGEKVIIVSDWVKYLDIIGEHLEYINGATSEAYTGATLYPQRERIVDKFNNTNEIMVLLLSLRAGGQGLNLKGANHVIIVDVHWNPQLEVQAEDRVYRIGQARPVFIHKFICPDTIEEKIVDLQAKKLRIAEAVLAGSRHEVRRLELAEMCRLFNIG